MADDKAVDAAAAFNAALEHTVPVLPHIGVHLVEVREGRAVSRIPFAGNGNHFGTMYAGSMFCVGEVLAGALAMASFDPAESYPLVKTMTIDYRKPAQTDVTASATLDAQTLERMRTDLAETGRAKWRHDVELHDADGELVATMSGDCQIRAR